MAVDAKSFRDVMACYPSGVTVVTTAHEGRRHGMTVAAFSSVSLDPPMVLVCIANSASSRGPIEAAGRFAVHFLASDQGPLALAFGGKVKPEDRFDGMETDVAESGAPILRGCVAWVDCAVMHTYSGGDHAIFVGRVIATQVRGGEPLITAGRSFRTLAPA
jgi:flavin reductase (DIM6/NTAB) family NADH-FMN oxidoreductase RutF